jgi:hypothetical protein
MAGDMKLCSADYDWVFLKRDGSKAEATLSDVSVPNLGDRTVYLGATYEVRHVIAERRTSANPLVVATEHPSTARRREATDDAIGTRSGGTV